MFETAYKRPNIWVIDTVSVNQIKRLIPRSVRAKMMAELFDRHGHHFAELTVAKRGVRDLFALRCDGRVAFGHRVGREPRRTHEPDVAHIAGFLQELAPRPIRVVAAPPPCDLRLTEDREHSVEVGLGQPAQDEAVSVDDHDGIVCRAEWPGRR